MVGERARFRPGREAWVLLLVALALRIGALVALADPVGIEAGGARWDWGYEQAAVARSLERGDGFSDAFGKGTGATAWCTPVYPALLAGLARVTGGMDRGMAIALAVLQSLLSAGTCVLLWRLGAAAGSRRAGRVAGWAWALHPAAIYYAVSLVWDSVLVAFAVTWFLAALAERREPSTWRSTALGVGFGLVLIVNPAPVALVPAVIWFLARAPAIAGFALGTLLVIAPWSVRNFVQVRTFGLRSNLGVELMVGNNDGAEGSFNGSVHPAYHDGQFAKYEEFGEAEYSAYAFGLARGWIAQNPGRFAALTATRVARFWVGRDPRVGIPLGDGSVKRRDWTGWVKWAVHGAAGLLALAFVFGFRDRRRGPRLVRAALLLFPLVYYVTHVFERYRLPVEPLVTLAAVWFVLRLWGRRDVDS